MVAVNQMKPSPLVDTERAKNEVGNAGSRAEERFSFVEEAIDAG
jgi:hypothetical protein